MISDRGLTGLAGLGLQAELARGLYVQRAIRAIVQSLLKPDYSRSHEIVLIGSPGLQRHRCSLA
jgi:hypothetical protein